MASKPEPATNHRNGSSAKTVLTEEGALCIEVPRDRDGSIELLMISKHERRFTGLDVYRLGLSGHGLAAQAASRMA